jgi:hypothetical protein
MAILEADKVGVILAGARESEIARVAGLIVSRLKLNFFCD